MNIQEKVGKRIKELRNKQGLSQEAFADKAGIDRTYLNSVENGRRNISIKNLEKISNALNLPIKELFNF